MGAFVIASWYIRQPGGKQLFASINAPALPDASLMQTFGMSPWPAVVLLTVLTGVLVWHHLKRKSFPVPQPKPRKQGITHWLFEARWHPFVSAVLIGVIALMISGEFLRGLGSIIVGGVFIRVCFEMVIIAFKNNEYPRKIAEKP
ncbi:YeeE/YedE thiosulfate transporter family protein [Serratia silvae]